MRFVCTPAMKSAALLLATEGSHVARGKRLPIAFIAVPLLSLFGLTACLGAPRGLVQQPTFELKSPTGLVGVTIREPLPGRTDSEFETLVKQWDVAGHTRVNAGDPPLAPFPERQLVWHVSLDVPHHTRD